MNSLKPSCEQDVGNKMRTRAIKDLLQLDDKTFFAEIAEGLGLIIGNARRLYASAGVLTEAKRFHAARVLEVVSEEEASKYLILLDAVRCPRKPAQRLASQLDRFNNHLAKGLYARSCWMRAATLEQLREHIDRDRDEFYLDGPNDVDWLFRNEILRSREEVLYVDYVAHDDIHTWVHPTLYDEADPLTRVEPYSLKLAGLLHDAGLSDSDALNVVAEVWRPAPIFPNMEWRELRALTQRTLETLDSRNLLKERPNSEYEQIIEWWQFPLYALELSLREVDKKSLREKQRLWTPDW